MPPKKQKEKAFSLEDFTKIVQEQSSGRSWADDEAEFSTPAFQTAGKPSFSTEASTLGSWTSGSGSGADFTSSSRGGFGSAAPAPIPDEPPFTARVSNLSYDCEEMHLMEFFGTQHNLKIESLRLPRGPDGQIRGAAYIDFADRDSLVAALKLGGNQILNRTFGVSTVEQRGPPGSFGGPRGGDAEFDWSKKGEANDFFAAGPPPGSGVAEGDRFSRFRPRTQRPEEPELDWSARSGPDSLGPARGGAPRAPRPEEPELDWSARSGPIAAAGPRAPRTPRAPEPELDWSARSGPIAPRQQRAPRSPRAAEPELDWSARTGPIASRAPRQQRAPRAAEPEFDWTQRGAAPGKSGSAFRGGKPGSGALGGSAGSTLGSTSGAFPSSSSSSQASSTSNTTSSAPADSKGDRKNSRIAKLQQGFKALQLDDDDHEEETAKSNTAAAAPASSISEIQKAQREANSGEWKS